MSYETNMVVGKWLAVIKRQWIQTSILGFLPTTNSKPTPTLQPHKKSWFFSLHLAYISFSYDTWRLYWISNKGGQSLAHMVHGHWEHHNKFRELWILHVLYNDALTSYHQCLKLLIVRLCISQTNLEHFTSRYTSHVCLSASYTACFLNLAQNVNNIDPIWNMKAVRTLSDGYSGHLPLFRLMNEKNL